MFGRGVKSSGLGAPVTPWPSPEAAQCVARALAGPRRVIFIRHGETDYNREKRLQGQRDIPLNSTGLEQARQIRLQLSPTALAFVSPLQRALATAQICLAGHSAARTMTLLPDLMERSAPAVWLEDAVG